MALAAIGARRRLVQHYSKCTAPPLISEHKQRGRKNAEQHMMDACLQRPSIVTPSQRLAFPSLQRQRAWEAEEMLTSEQ